MARGQNPVDRFRSPICGRRGAVKTGRNSSTNDLSSITRRRKSMGTQRRYSSTRFPGTNAGSAGSQCHGEHARTCLTTTSRLSWVSLFYPGESRGSRWFAGVARAPRTHAGRKTRFLPISCACHFPDPTRTSGCPNSGFHVGVCLSLVSRVSRWVVRSSCRGITRARVKHARDTVGLESSEP